MEEFRPAVGQKEGIAPETVPLYRGFNEFLFRGGARADDPRQARQDECRVEIVRPRLIPFITVSPGAISTLAIDHVSCPAHSPFAEIVFAGQRAYRSERLCGEQTGVKYARAVNRRVAPTNFKLGLLAAG